MQNNVLLSFSRLVSYFPTCVLQPRYFCLPAAFFNLLVQPSSYLPFSLIVGLVISVFLYIHLVKQHVYVNCTI